MKYSVEEIFTGGYRICGPQRSSYGKDCFTVEFTPNTLMPHRRPDGEVAKWKPWFAVVVVDRAADCVVHHEPLSPRVGDLTDQDFEAKALELVRAMSVTEKNCG